VDSIINLHKEVTFLGISDYVTGQAYQSNCQCISDVKVCMIREEEIKLLLESNFIFSRKVMKTIAMDYHQSNKRMLSITKKHMSARLAGALLELIEFFGTLKSGEIDVYMKRSELATLSCMSSANVTRNLSLFQKLGFIVITGKQIQIINQDALIRESEIS
jgi:CRP-like cAMP-binding protein